MRLADWIRANMEPILKAWERDAERILPCGKFQQQELRDHAEAMLERIATEITQPRTAHQRSARSRGTGNRSVERTGAQKHGAERMVGGAGMIAMATEFRALRQSVITLWTEDESGGDHRDREDIAHFNEAIDQALMESIESFINEQQKQERLFDTMLLSLPDPNYILDPSGRFLHANTATTALYGIPLKELTGKTFAELDPPTQEDRNREIERVVTEQVQRRGEMTVKDPCGHTRHYEYIHVPVLDTRNQTEAVVGTARDITERRTSEAKIWHHANHDPVTGLPNRRLFQDRLKQHTRHAERLGASLAVLFIDLDRFKDVNDNLGHDAGDLLLQQAAARIVTHVRETDTVARLGGDEFTVILLDIADQAQIDQIARDILAELEQPFHLNEATGNISASIGITRYPQDARNAHQLLKNADQAMYAAKKSGRNRYAHFPNVADRRMRGHGRLAAELRQALAHREFDLHYQPIVDLRTQHIAKVEALLRWVHPSRGLLPAADFIELAEETGLLREIETWVFAQAMQAARQWRGLSGPGFQVMLNQSPVQFCQRIPGTSWNSGLAHTDPEGSGLAIEVTEKIFSQDEEQLARNLNRLADAGIAVALDDFGTGQSSLAYLKKFNIGFLKIAPSFIHSYDVDQGFWFSRPLPASQFQALLAGNSSMGA